MSARDELLAQLAARDPRRKRRAEAGAEDGETEEQALARYEREKAEEEKAERKKIIRTFKQKAVENPTFVDTSKELANMDLLKSIFTS